MEMASITEGFSGRDLAMLIGRATQRMAERALSQPGQVPVALDIIDVYASLLAHAA